MLMGMASTQSKHDDQLYAWVSAPDVRCFNNDPGSRQITGAGPGEGRVRGRQQRKFEAETIAVDPAVFAAQLDEIDRS